MGDRLLERAAVQYLMAAAIMSHDIAIANRDEASNNPRPSKNLMRPGARCRASQVTPHGLPMPHGSVESTTAGGDGYRQGDHGLITR